MAALFSLAAYWIADVQAERPRRAVMQYRVASVEQPPPTRPETESRADPVPRQPSEPREPSSDIRRGERVDFRASDLVATGSHAPPSAAAGPGGGGGGRLNLAAEAEGGGDVFDLAAKPGGRGILGGGRLGDSSREDSDDSDDDSGEGSGPGESQRARTAQRYAWYYAKRLQTSRRPSGASVSSVTPRRAARFASGPTTGAASI